MDIQLILAIASFALVTSVTPGPNNLMLLQSGANYGFRNTIPHMLGIAAGMQLLLLLTLAGLAQLFSTFPLTVTILKLLGTGYLLWLAWGILNTSTHSVKQDGSRGNIPASGPLHWWQATLFQFVNPKAWMMCISAVGSFTLAGEQFLFSAMLIMLVFFVVNLPSISLWAGFGSLIQRFLSTAKNQRLFNAVMAALLALTVITIIA